MSDLFEKALAHTLTFEGGYANDPADRGGETFRGISRRSWPKWPGWEMIDELKDRGHRSARQIDAALADHLEMAKMVSDFYYHNFWKPFESLKAPGRVMAKLFDTAVNVGKGAAVKFLQRAVNALGPLAPLAEDGIIGPRTEAAFDLALDEHGEAALLKGLSRQQGAYYRNIVARRPVQARFLKGWLRRAAWIPSQE